MQPFSGKPTCASLTQTTSHDCEHLSDWHFICHWQWSEPTRDKQPFSLGNALSASVGHLKHEYIACAFCSWRGSYHGCAAMKDISTTQQKLAYNKASHLFNFKNWWCPCRVSFCLRNTLSAL